MIVDTSTVLAVLFREADAAHYARTIAPLLHLAGCRLPICWKRPSSSGAAALQRTASSDLFIEEGAIELMPVTVEQVDSARRAWRRFGKGNHPAALNFGDCFAYALADTTGEPLLFKGEDFARTDVAQA